MIYISTSVSMGQCMVSYNKDHKGVGLGIDKKDRF